MSQKYIAPEFNLDAFNCPLCGAYAYQLWGGLGIWFDGHEGIDDMQGARCSHCEEFSLWKNEKMIFPLLSTAPQAVEDMPADVKDVFEEARMVAALSPKAAAALLRLALQKLLPYIGGKGKDVDKDIGNLVKVGLSTDIQQALDYVRVIGNNAVHPGKIDIDDNPEVANILFSLLNFVVEEKISFPKRREAFYKSLPKSQLEHINERDNHSETT